LTLPLLFVPEIGFFLFLLDFAVDRHVTILFKSKLFQNSTSL
jgi:hypothetical protein